MSAPRTLRLISPHDPPLHARARSGFRTSNPHYVLNTTQALPPEATRGFGHHGCSADRDYLRFSFWPVAHAATELLTSDGLDRLKLCVGCYWLFLDASRNRSRRWCAMEVCGTHEKARRYVSYQPSAISRQLSALFWLIAEC